jgi:CxxC motif-containing protein
MTINEKIICITCPKGCTLDVTREGQTVIKIRPGCKRGHDYVQRELTDPRRMVATTVRVRGGLHPLLPVATAAPFPKPRIFELMAALRSLELPAPIKNGQPVLENALGTGIDILASRDMPGIGRGEERNLTTDK